MIKKLPLLQLALFLLSVLYTGCIYVPPQTREEWARETSLSIAAPSAAGLDSSVIAQIENDIAAGKWINVHGLIIIKDGKLVSEGYWNGSRPGKLHDIRSAAKSVTSILVGMAIDRGYIHSADDPVYDYFPGYEPEFPNSLSEKDQMKWLNELSIGHLLNMTSGFEYDDWTDNFRGEYEIGSSSNWIETAATAGLMRRPGTYYAYNTGSLVLLSGIISSSTGVSAGTFAEEDLFLPMGITQWKWRSRKDVLYMGGNLWLTLRDMSKIGLLILNDGMMNNRRLLSSQWIDEITTELDEDEPSQQRYNFYHHYLWWRFEDEVKGKRVKGYYASGNGGQMIMVIPDLNMVCAITTGNYNTGLEQQSVELIREVLKAVKAK